MSALAPAPTLLGGASLRSDSGFLRRLLRRPIAVACLCYLALIVGVAVVAPFVLPGVSHEQAGDLLHIRQGPSWHHLLGTDSLGRDVLDRLLVGTRVTLIGVVEAVAVALALGVPLGLGAGYLGGRFDRAFGWLTNLTFSMPAVAIAIVVLAVFPGSMLAGMVTIGVIASPGLGRIVRSATLPVKSELYIAAARVSGMSRPYIISRHVLPRITGSVIVLASLFAAAALLAQTGLAYLGVIVAAPAPSWGGMVADGIQAIVLQPWLIWPPGVAMTLTVVALGLLGDVARDANAESWSSATTRRRRIVRSNRDSGVALAGETATSLLTVRGLTVTLRTSAGSVDLVRDVSFEIAPNETVGLAGESGCGKTVTAMSLLGLPPGTTEITAGSIVFDGRDVVTASESELQRLRGRAIGLITQEPMASLNPAFRIGFQIAMSIRRHRDLDRRAARLETVDLLRRVHLPDPEAVAHAYPHELSGGMAQRVTIARALAGEPKLLIADEPTTALDVTVQAEILDLLRELQEARGMSILLVTHDWGVVADLCDRAVIMYAGEIVEQAALEPLFDKPLHPYTRALLAADPHHAPDGTLLPTIPGTVAKPGAWPTGCHFHPRCAYATDACRTTDIPLARPEPGRTTRCIHYESLERE